MKSVDRQKSVRQVSVEKEGKREGVSVKGRQRKMEVEKIMIDENLDSRQGGEDLELAQAKNEKL